MSTTETATNNINTNVTEAELTSTLSDNYKASMRAVAVETLANHKNITMGQLVRLTGSPEHGPIISSVTLEEIVSHVIANMDREALTSILPETEETTTVQAEVTTTTKAATKTTTKKGGKRAAIDRGTGVPAILAIAEEEFDAMSISQFKTKLLEKTGTEFSENHLRTMLKEQVTAGTLVVEGSGRGTKYKAK